MKLLFTRNSPYARRIRVAVRATGLLERVSEIDVTPHTENLAELLTYGPGGKVPVLVTDDGVSLCESLVIARYLDELSDGALYPQEASARLRAVEVESLACVLMDSLFTRSRENRRDPALQSADIISLEQTRAARLYDRLNELAGFGDTLNMPGITVACCLEYSDWRHPADAWRNGRSALGDWLERVCDAPALTQTTPPGD